MMKRIYIVVAFVAAVASCLRVIYVLHGDASLTEVSWLPDFKGSVSRLDVVVTSQEATKPWRQDGSLTPTKSLHEGVFFDYCERILLLGNATASTAMTTDPIGPHSAGEGTTSAGETVRGGGGSEKLVLREGPFNEPPEGRNVTQLAALSMDYLLTSELLRSRCYMDEIFHVPMTAFYAVRVLRPLFSSEEVAITDSLPNSVDTRSSAPSSSFQKGSSAAAEIRSAVRTWDPMITTPPTSYVVGTLLIHGLLLSSRGGDRQSAAMISAGSSFPASRAGILDQCLVAIAGAVSPHIYHVVGSGSNPETTEAPAANVQMPWESAAKSEYDDEDVAMDALLKVKWACCVCAITSPRTTCQSIETRLQESLSHPAAATSTYTSLANPSAAVSTDGSISAHETVDEAYRPRIEHLIRKRQLEVRPQVAGETMPTSSPPYAAANGEIAHFAPAAAEVRDRSANRTAAMLCRLLARDVLSRIATWSVTLCRLSSLLSWIALFALATLATGPFIQRSLSTKATTTTTQRSVRRLLRDHDGGRQCRDAAVNGSLFPPLVFSAALHYTDTHATLAAVGMILLAIRTGEGVTTGRHYPSLRWWSIALVGGLATCVRQTSIVWLAYLAGLYGLAPIIQWFSGAATTDLGSKRRGFWYHVFFREALLRRVLQHLWPVMGIAAAFLYFVLVVNGGSVVLGDVANHVPGRNWAQLSLFFATVALMSPATSLWVPFKAFAATAWKRSRAPRTTTLVPSPAVDSESLSSAWDALLRSAAMGLLFALHLMLLTRGYEAHPFVLSDNRHVTFYVHRRLLSPDTSWWVARLVIVPFLATMGTLRLFDTTTTLSSECDDAASPRSASLASSASLLVAPPRRRGEKVRRADRRGHSKNSEKKEDDDDPSAWPSSKGLSRWLLVTVWYVLCLAAVVVPQKLLEFRYFVVPYFVLQMKPWIERSLGVASTSGPSQPFSATSVDDEQTTTTTAAVHTKTTTTSGYATPGAQKVAANAGEVGEVARREVMNIVVVVDVLWMVTLHFLLTFLFLHRQQWVVEAAVENSSTNMVSIPESAGRSINRRPSTFMTVHRPDPDSGQRYESWRFMW